MLNFEKGFVIDLLDFCKRFFCIRQWNPFSSGAAAGSSGMSASEGWNCRRQRMLPECPKKRVYPAGGKTYRTAQFFGARRTIPLTNAVNGAVEASPKLPATVLIISEATMLLFKML